MNFELSDDQKMILDTVRTFVKRELPIERMRKMREDELGYSREIWSQMGQLGWLGISFPESLGGFGGSFVDASLILRQFGTTLVSEPYADAALVAGHALLAAGSEAQQQQWLAPMLQGETQLALAHAEADNRFSLTQLASRAEKQGAGYRLRGSKVWVLHGASADQLLISARTSGAGGERQGISLFAVDKDTAGLTIKPLKTMDGRRAAALEFDVELPAERLLGEEGQAAEALALAQDIGAAATCCEGHGVMRSMLKMTIEYLKTREQFGIKIGTFQALQHRAVDMFIEAQLAESTAVMASIKVGDADPVERARAISAAKVQLAVSGRLVSQQAIQLHGGIGITDEHDIGLYFKRMHVLTTLYGDEMHHSQRYASLPSFEAGLAAAS